MSALRVVDGQKKLIDFVVKAGERVADLEVKYKIPSRAGAALNRLVLQMQASLAAAGPNSSTVLFTFKEPTLREISLLYEELGPAATKIQFVHGLNGLVQWLNTFFISSP